MAAAEAVEAAVQAAVACCCSLVRSSPLFMTQSWHRTIDNCKCEIVQVQVKTSPSVSLSLSQRTFAGGVSFFVYICWLLVAAAWCCQNFLPNLYAPLLAAAPLRALFFALAFALAIPACYFYFCDTSACACMLLHSHVCVVIGCARFSFSKRKECLKRE